MRKAQKCRIRTGGDGDAGRATVRHDLWLLQKDMQLDLVARRSREAGCLEAFEVGDAKIADPHAFDEPFGLEPVHCLIRVDEMAVVRGMNEVEIDVVEPEALETLLAVGNGGHLAAYVVPQFRRHKHLIPRDAAGANAFADTFLVAIEGGLS